MTQRIFFHACFSTKECVPRAWYIYSSYSNHMTSYLHIFSDLDENVTSHIMMGDGTIFEA